MFQPTLTPAFGRDYRSKKEVIDALNAGDVDFLCLPQGSYINGSGIPLDWTNISVRYKKLCQQIIVNRVDGVFKVGYK